MGHSDCVCVIHETGRLAGMHVTLAMPMAFTSHIDVANRDAADAADASLFHAKYHNSGPCTRYMAHGVDGWSA